MIWLRLLSFFLRRKYALVEFRDSGVVSLRRVYRIDPAFWISDKNRFYELNRESWKVTPLFGFTDFERELFK